MEEKVMASEEKTESNENTDNVELEQADQVAETFTKVEEELKSLEDRYLRLAAEFENYKVRNEREKQSAIKFANERILQDLLPIIDNLEHALIASHSHNDASSSDVFKTVVTGVEMVLKQFKEMLQRYQIESFESKGQKFDPQLHEALAEQESDTEKGVVLAELQKGYMLNGRLVRAARVIVSKGKNTPE